MNTRNRITHLEVIILLLTAVGLTLWYASPHFYWSIGFAYQALKIWGLIPWK